MTETLTLMLEQVRSLREHNRTTAAFSKSYIHALDNMEKLIKRRLRGLELLDATNSAEAEEAL